MPMRASLSLRLPRSPSTVAVARHACRATLQPLGVTPQCIADLSVAVTEACANAVEHAGEGGETYEVRMDVHDAWICILVVDDGEGFDADRIPFELPDEFAVRGRGLGLMRHLVDDLVVSSSTGSGTRVLLRKRLEVVEPTPPAGRTVAA